MNPFVVVFPSNPANRATLLRIIELILNHIDPEANQSLT
jgi:hypothetical protein